MSRGMSLFAFELIEIRICVAIIFLQPTMKSLLSFQVMAQRIGLITEISFSGCMVEILSASATCIHLILLSTMSSSFLMVKMAGIKTFLHTKVQMAQGGLPMLLRGPTLHIA